MLAGCRKWKLELIDRSDLASLSERAEMATGIPTVDKLEEEAIERIIG